MELILALIILAINLTIQFFLMRAASKSAAKDVLSDYSTPIDILISVQRLERQISEIQKESGREAVKNLERQVAQLQKELARMAVSRQEGGSVSGHESDPESHPEAWSSPANPQQLSEESEPLEPAEAYLIEGPNSYSWSCSLCGQRQPSNRTCCFRCSAVFGSKPS